MPATFSIPLITVIPGQIISAALWNGEYTNIYNNFIPAGMDDYSVNDSQMQVQTDPFPSGATSRATSLQGEIERLRFQLANILGETYWYNDPDATVAALTARVVTLEALIVSGTAMVFYQAAAPTGWTAVAVNDKFLRVVSAGGSGGSAGGSGLAPSSTITLAHSHTVSSHTHSISSDGAHTHSVAAHQHVLDYTIGTGDTTFGVTDLVVSANADGQPIGKATGSGGSNRRHINVTKTDGSGTTGSNGAHTHTGATGAATPGMDSQLSNIAFQYADVIVATKN